MKGKVVTDRGFGWWVPDTPGASTSAGVLLGPVAKDLTDNAVGVDALFDSPVYVRAYATAADSMYDRIGYVGFVEAFVGGQPVPPEVVGGDIARLQPYAAGKEHGYISVAFMEPDNARKLVPGAPPFFAYNAKLFSEGGNIGSIGNLGEPGISGSLGRSMLAQVNVPLVTEQDVDEMVEGLDPLIEVKLGPDDTKGPLYDMVIRKIIEKANTDKWLRADVEGKIALESIPRIRMAGRYMLLNVANPEYRQPVLAARLWNGMDVSLSNPTWLRVHLLDYHEMCGLEVTATMRLINDAVAVWQGIPENSGMPSNKSRGRGTGGRDRPGIAFPDGKPVLRIRLSGMAYGQSADAGPTLWGLSPISGFSVDLVWKYDEPTRIMVLDRDNIAINSIAAQAEEYRAALNAYESALGKDSAMTIENTGSQSIGNYSTQDTMPESTPPPDEESAFRLISLEWATAGPEQPRPNYSRDWEDLD
jgi:hypothetical protein